MRQIDTALAQHADLEYALAGIVADRIRQICWPADVPQRQIGDLAGCQRPGILFDPESSGHMAGDRRQCFLRGQPKQLEGHIHRQQQ